MKRTKCANEEPIAVGGSGYENNARRRKERAVFGADKTPSRENLLALLAAKIKKEAVILLCAASLQLAAGAVSLFSGGYFLYVGIALLAVSALNFALCFFNFRYVKKISACPVRIVAHFKPVWWRIWLCVCNFVCGGIGVAGSVADFLTRGFVMRNQGAFNMTEADFMRKNSITR